MPLTDVAIRKAKLREKLYKIADGGGLYLLVTPDGGKYWRLKYRSPVERNRRGDPKEKLMGLGVYPAMRLPEAREKRDEAKKLLKAGRDPLMVRQEEKRTATLAAGNTFETIAREWFAKFSPKWAKAHADKIIRRFERDIFPWLGKRPITAIMAPDLLAALRRIEGRGAIDTAHRAHQNCGQVFRYAIATGRAERDPSPDLRVALPPAEGKPYASIKEPQAIGRCFGRSTDTMVTRDQVRPKAGAARVRAAR